MLAFLGQVPTEDPCGLENFVFEIVEELTGPSPLRTHFTRVRSLTAGENSHIIISLNVNRAAKAAIYLLEPDVPNHSGWYPLLRKGEFWSM